MKIQKSLLCLMLLTASAVGNQKVGASEIRNVEEYEKKVNYPPGASIESNNKQGRVFFAFYSSTSVTVLVTTTLNALSTCLSTTGVVVCNGKKRKRNIQDLELISVKEPVIENLNSSIDGQGKADMKVLQDLRTGRKLTLWSTNYSTLTVTTTSFISGTTISINAACTAPGVANSCFG